jgi:hypothetical protein
MRELPLIKVTNSLERQGDIKKINMKVRSFKKNQMSAQLQKNFGNNIESHIYEGPSSHTQGRATFKVTK